MPVPIFCFLLKAISYKDRLAAIHGIALKNCVILSQLRKLCKSYRPSRFWYHVPATSPHIQMPLRRLCTHRQSAKRFDCESPLHASLYKRRADCNGGHRRTTYAERPFRAALTAHRFGAADADYRIRTWPTAPPDYNRVFGAFFASWARVESSPVSTPNRRFESAEPDTSPAIPHKLDVREISSGESRVLANPHKERRTPPAQMDGRTADRYTQIHGTPHSGMGSSCEAHPCTFRRHVPHRQSLRRRTDSGWEKTHAGRSVSPDENPCALPLFARIQRRRFESCI